MIDAPIACARGCLRCSEPMNGHHCTRAEHSAWEPHVWAVDETPARCDDDATDTDGAKS